ncbi:MAG: hypothetical protein ACO29C_01510 [Fluviibacter sp.]
MAKSTSTTETPDTTQPAEDTATVTVTVVEAPVEAEGALRPETISEMEAGKAALARYQKA